MEVEIVSDRWLYTDRASIDSTRHLTVTMNIEPGDGYTVEEAAGKIVQIVTLGSSRHFPFEDPETRRKAAGKILSVPDRTDSGRIELAYPLDLGGVQEGLSYIMTLLSYPAEYNYTDSYLVEKVSLPTKLRKNLPGPNYGNDGLRAVLGVEGRPVLGLLTKPRLGVDLSVLCENCREALIGGADFVVDDELIIDPATSLKFENRIEEMVRVRDEAAAEAGEQKAYFANISADVDAAIEYAVLAEEAGVDGVVMNAFAMGFPALRKLVESEAFDLPIITTNVGVGILTRFGDPRNPAGTTGISEQVIAKLSRYAGADGVHIGIAEGEWYEVEASSRRAVPLDAQIGSIAPSTPVVAGGLSVENVWRNIKILGSDMIMEAGRGILGYPAGGPREGAEALRVLLERLSSEMTQQEAEQIIAETADDLPHIKKAFDHYGAEMG